MKKYIQPDVELVSLKATDIVATSDLIITDEDSEFMHSRGGDLELIFE